MKPGLLHIGWNLARCMAAMLAMAVVFFAAPAFATGNDAAEHVTKCFEGPAAKAAAKAKGNDDFSRSLAEMGAGKLCEEMAGEIIRNCLAGIEGAEGDGGARDYYPCIGIVANPCIDSEWASNEFRSVVCVGTEEKVWLDIVHENLDKLRTSLDGERKQRFEAMEKGFFEFRNGQCGLVRMLRKSVQPDLGYGACTAEAAARFAIDLRDMVEVVKKNGKTAASADTVEKVGGKEQPSEEARQQPKEEKKPDDAVAADTAAAELGSKSAPVRAGTPAGEQAYLQRLRCPDGSAPSFTRQGSMGHGGYGHIVDLYKVRCENTGESHDVYMDMYFPGYVETQPVKGFTLTTEQP